MDDHHCGVLISVWAIPLVPVAGSVSAQAIECDNGGTIMCPNAFHLAAMVIKVDYGVILPADASRKKLPLSTMEKMFNATGFSIAKDGAARLN